MRFTPIFIYLLFSFSSFGIKEVFSQSAEPYRFDFSGQYSLHQILDTLQTDLEVAYSRDKISNIKVLVKQGQLLNDFLDNLTAKNLLQYRYDQRQLIISPYKPKSYTINGVVKDMETGEHVIGATVLIVGTQAGAITNGYGYFSITLFQDNYDVRISHIGYSTFETSVDLNKNIYIKTNLLPTVTSLQEVEISSSLNSHIENTIPSVNEINLQETAGHVPYLFGEVDIIQNALLQPGIKTIGEDASGFHVRGGGVDQNLALLDEATVYNPNHFFGLISVFNPEAVNNVRIFKGYIPPSYGGRASSIMEVRQREGNNQKTSYSGGIGYVSARGLVEGPIKKGISSFLVSGRQSLLGLSTSDFGSSSVRRNRVRFQDINVKINTRPNSRNQYYVSGYYGNDRNAVGLNSVRRWGNRVLNFRWSHLYSPQLFSNLAAYVSEYNYRIENDEEPGAFRSRSRIRDLGLKADYAYTFETSNEILFGMNATLHGVLPGSREPLDPDGTSTNIIELEKERGLESALYLGHNFQLRNINLNYGLRLSAIHTFGPRNVFLYENNIPASDTLVVDTMTFASGDLVNSFHTFEPRFAFNWILNENLAIKASYTRNSQYIHLISNTISPSPTDIWKLSDDYIPPLIADQYTMGLYKNLKQKSWAFSAEAYYKDISNNIQYKDGADLIFNENIETELILSNARAYGLELYLQKKKGKLKGWLSYSLSRAESKIIENERERFIPDNFDKTHDFSTSWNFQFSNRVSSSANFIFNTGIPVTLPTDKYVFEGNLVPSFSTRNNARIPNYHRLDLSLRINGKEYRKNGEKRKNRDFLIVTLYNVYARKNAYSYFFRESETNPGIGEIVQYSVFATMIPAITYHFKF